MDVALSPPHRGQVHDHELRFDESGDGNWPCPRVLVLTTKSHGGLGMMWPAWV